MKKIYSKPETVCIDIQVQHMICDSINDTSGADGLGVGGNSGDNGITTGNSRRGGSWSDED